MTTTHDPSHPLYFDEADVRNEMTRVFDLCSGCRMCFKYCSSFPTLFSYIDAHDDQDAGRLTPAQQDQVVDECFQCKLCYVNCPYTPGLHDWAIDFPRLMLRAQAMRRSTSQVALRDRATTQFVARTDLLGRVAGPASSTVNKVLGAPRGSIVRKVVEKTVGVSAERLLPPFSRTRFTTWFKQRPGVRIAGRSGRVAVYPTCLVEYQAPAIGKDLVGVYERNGLECTLTSTTRCCGAPWLHAGDVEEFSKIAARNVAALAESVRSGRDIVVPQPTCSYVLKREYPVYAPGPDAQLVAEHTFDTSEYLIRLHKSAEGPLDMDFSGDVPQTITYHTPCHLRAQNIGFKSRDLMKLTGARVKLVQQCSGTDGMWGLKANNAQFALPIAHQLGAQIEKSGGEVVSGDCHLANTAITEQTGRIAAHPLQVIARAYGISADDDERR